ncbi:uncharacterized protein LOC122329503 [Tachysurus ichikawai]
MTAKLIKSPTCTVDIPPMQWRQSALSNGCENGGIWISLCGNITARREPVQELISSFSSLYLESEGGVAVPEEDHNSSCLPPPPPPEKDEESLISLIIATKNFRGTVNSFDDLVHTGALVEWDMAEERAFWKQRQAEQPSRRGGQYKYNRAVMDTGSSYSLIQESLWRRWKDETESWQSSPGQTFSLANDHSP